jgi:hypothetical protein
VAKKKRANYSKDFIYLIYILCTIFILLLSIFNLQKLDQDKSKVLGVQTTNDTNKEFWKDFVEKHPDYIDGWLELGRADKVKQIDPNYFQP